MRVGARRDHRGFDGRAVRQQDAARPALGRDDPAHFRFAADVHAEPRADRLQRVGQPAHAAPHVAPYAARPAGAPHGMVQQDAGGAGCGRRRERADDGVGGEGRAQRLGLEPALQDRPRRTGQQLDGGRQVGPQPAHAAVERPQPGGAAQPRGRPDAAPAAGAGEQVRRRAGDDRLERVRHPVEKGAVARERRGVAPAERGDGALVGGAVRAEQQMAPVGERRERRRIAGQDRQAVLLQPQIADDLRQQQADDVRARGDPVPRPEGLGRRAAAEHAPPFEDAHRPAGLREIGGGNQAVVSAADDDAVVRAVLAHCREATSMRHSQDVLPDRGAP